MRYVSIALATLLLHASSTAAQDVDRAGAAAAFEAFYDGITTAASPFRMPDPQRALVFAAALAVNVS